MHLRQPTSITPNGFNGEEACILMRYAGLSPNIDTVGIYGYMHEKDRDNLTAKQISHMLWYLIDGRSRGTTGSKAGRKESFNEFTIAFAEIEDCIFSKANAPAAGGCNYPINNSSPAPTKITCWPAPMKFPNAGSAHRKEAK